MFRFGKKMPGRKNYLNFESISKKDPDPLDLVFLGLLGSGSGSDF